MKRNIIYLVIALLSRIIVYNILHGELIFGQFINTFIHCKQGPGSFPCYGIFDIYLAGFFFIILIIAIGILYKHLFDYIKTKI